jgi:hypothetical protein
MIDIFGEIYYIDFDQVDLFLGWDPQLKAGETIETQTTKILNGEGDIISTEVIESKSQKPREINGVRFELIRNFIEDLNDSSLSSEDSDEKLGGDKPTNTSLGFRLAFNTLRAYDILKPLVD